MIETDISKRACKLKKVYPVQVEGRIISKNEDLSTSLTEIATSSGYKSFFMYNVYILILSLFKSVFE